MKDIVIFDIDKTLACNTHREHLLPTVDLHKTSSWEAYNLACSEDALLGDNASILRALAKVFSIVLVTGRSDVCRKQTERWLERHNIPYNGLFMRKSSDDRKDTVVKEDILLYIGLASIVCAFDDSPSIVSHFRSLGITTYQVCEDIKCVSTKSWGI